MKHAVMIAALVVSTITWAQKSIPFTLHNSSLKSVPLIIPGVMNPNLSPLSDSGVELKPGQRILFREKGRKYLLIEITEDQRTEDNDRIRLDVSELLRQRRMELGLRNKMP